MIIYLQYSEESTEKLQLKKWQKKKMAVHQPRALVSCIQPGLAKRDGMGREVGGGVQEGEHMQIHGWFMLIYGKSHYNTVK